MKPRSEAMRRVMGQAAPVVAPALDLDRTWAVFAGARKDMLLAWRGWLVLTPHAGHVEDEIVATSSVMRRMRLP